VPSRPDKDRVEQRRDCWEKTQHAQRKMHSLGVKVIEEDHIKKGEDKLCREQKTIVGDIKGQVCPIKQVQGET